MQTIYQFSPNQQFLPQHQQFPLNRQQNVQQVLVLQIPSKSKRVAYKYIVKIFSFNKSTYKSRILG